jgi:NAD(P)-dependent dehydrogenase (short-subunit alcohol dehydrogenase family)
MDSTGKHGRVFGGTTGIGFGIAEKLPKHGANMSVASRKQWVRIGTGWSTGWTRASGRHVRREGRRRPGGRRCPARYQRRRVCERCP